MVIANMDLDCKAGIGTLFKKVFTTTLKICKRIEVLIEFLSNFLQYSNVKFNLKAPKLIEPLPLILKTALSFSYHILMISHSVSTQFQSVGKIQKRNF